MVENKKYNLYFLFKLKPQVKHNMAGSVNTCQTNNCSLAQSSVTPATGNFSFKPVLI